MWYWNNVPMNPMIPAFEQVKKRAANIGDGEQGDYTIDLFKADYPEFYTKTDDGNVTTLTPMLPEAIIQRYVDSANHAVIPSAWGDDWRIAAGLYVAHFVALRMQTFADGSTPAATAANSANVGTVKSATMGDTSLSYDNTATNSGTEKWGTWNLTRYGSQLATMARMIGIAGMYVI